MALFVIVHGAFGGGWEWADVAAALRSMGHEVQTPTLTGLGERANLATRDVNLTTHTQDLVALLSGEDLTHIFLCGASYGGMPVTGAADAVPDRIAGLVYIDALLPRNGEAAIDLLPESFAADVRQRARSLSEWLVPVPAAVLPPKLNLAASAWERYVSRLVGQPARTFTEPILLQGNVERLPRAFVRCTRSVLADDPIEGMAARARHGGLRYLEIAAPHDPQLFDPQGTAATIVKAAATLRAPKDS